MDKRRIAIVHYGFGCGGAEHMVSELASHVDKNRFDVQVICIYGQAEGNEMERFVEESGALLSFLGLEETLNRMTGIVRVWRALSEFKPDVIHTHLGALQYCLPWALTHGVKLLHTVHNVPDKEMSPGVVKGAVSWIYRTGRAVPVAISDHNRRLIAEYYGLPDDSVALVNNPVDVEFFHPPIQGDADSRRFDFINVAGMRPQKNQRLLLHAFARVVSSHPESLLCIVGDGVERQTLEELVAELGISASVELVGQASERAVVRDLLWSSKAFVLSSDYEGLPLSAIEAMACGLPVISTNVGGMSDIVQGNGVLVPAGDLDSLAGAMISALEDGFECGVSARSRELACQFGVNECASGYESLYEKCLVS